MQCMEVWGGNQVMDSNVEMSGLDGWVYSRPYMDAKGGGDVYYCSACATGRITRLLLADVSGHGDSVSEAAGVLRSLMRQFVNFIDQSRFVRSMNDQFTVLSADNIFATAIVATFFAPTGALSLCNAGHPPPLVYRAASREWTILQESEESQARTHDKAAGGNIPLGILDMAEYEQFDVTLQTDDRVLCYTDSLMEAKDPTGELLGVEGLLRLVKSVWTPQTAGNGKAFVDALLAAIAREYPTNLSDDDVTVMLVRANGQGRVYRFWPRFLAPFRLIRGIWQAWWRGEKLPLPEFSIANLGGAMIPQLGKPRRKTKP